MAQVTVVIPNYNGIAYMEGCLAALYADTSKVPFEVLVVDNGSTDGSAEAAEAFPAARLIRLPENTGFCHAVNVGIENSDTPYVILLNNDTKVFPGFVDALYDAINADEKLFGVSARMLMWDRPDLVDDAGDNYCALGWAYGRGKGKSADLYEKPAKVFSACGGAAIYRKAVFDRIGLFDELHFAYFEDLDVGYRARIKGYRNAYAPEAKVLHFGSASTGSRYNERKTSLASANSVYVVLKNMPLLQLLLNLPFLLVGFFVKFLFFARKKMGGLYLKGLWEGLRRSFSAEGRSHKVRFEISDLGHYLSIQGLLYVNLFRFLNKY